MKIATQKHASKSAVKKAPVKAKKVVKKVAKRTITTKAKPVSSTPSFSSSSSSSFNSIFAKKATPFSVANRGAKIDASELRNGFLIQWGDDNKPMRVQNLEKKMMGRRPTSLSMELKCLATGRLFPTRMMPHETVQTFDLDSITLSFLYADGEIGAVMNNDTYEQHEFPVLQFFSKEHAQWLPADTQLLCYFYQGELFSVTPPEFVQMTVKHVPINPAITRISGAEYKTVIMQNDLELKVPSFIEEGQMCKIRFEDLSFHSRVN